MTDFGAPLTDEEDLRPEWIKSVIFDVHFLHFGCILFLIVMVSVIAISLLTEPIPEECVSMLHGRLVREL